MSVKIQIPELKGYKVIKNPKLADLVDSTINKNYWNSEGWSSMYSAYYQEFFDLLKSGDFLYKKISLANTPDIFPSEFEEEIVEKGDQERLKQVFDFLEKKENKPNPTKDKSKDPEFKSLSKENTIVAGKRGFSVLDKTGRYGAPYDSLIQVYPYPADGVLSEDYGEVFPIIEDILDDGVFVVKTVEDILKIYSSKGMSTDEKMKKRMYLI